jgi:hypothetical protein
LVYQESLHDAWSTKCKISLNDFICLVDMWSRSVVGYRVFDVDLLVVGKSSA